MIANFRLLALVVTLVLMVVACESASVDSGAVVREKFEQRVAQLTASLLDDCQEDVITEASRRADSLLIDRARRMRRIEGRPPRPNRPGAPPVKQLSQPLPLRPLFPFEIRFDTLLRDSLFQDSLRTDSIDRGLLEDLLIEELNQEG